MTGHLRLSRDILDWGWYGDPNTRSVFIHLLLVANYEEKVYLGYNIKRGQAVVGLNVLAESLGLSIRNIRTALKHLKSTNEVTIKTTNKFSVVTICDFERWQGLDSITDNQSDNQSDKQLTSNRQASDIQVTTTKEIEEMKKERKKEDTIPPIAPQGAVRVEELLARIAELEARQKELEDENAALSEKVEKAKKAGAELDLSIVSEQMLPIVEEWLAYKRQKRQGYKPIGFVKFYNKLIKDCGGDVSVAREMLDYSIANNYDGLFKPKGNYKREPQGQVIREELDFNKGFFGL